MDQDHRRQFRLPMHTTVFIEVESAAPGELGPGRIARCQTLDVSPLGLKVQLTEAVTVGAILQIGVEVPSNAEPFYLVGQARWCEQDKHRLSSWRAGFEILNAAGSDVEQWKNTLQSIDEAID
jgi:hypothetical protein